MHPSIVKDELRDSEIRRVGSSDLLIVLEFCDRVCNVVTETWVCEVIGGKDGIQVLKSSQWYLFAIARLLQIILKITMSLIDGERIGRR